MTMHPAREDHDPTVDPHPFLEVAALLVLMAVGFIVLAVCVQAAA